MADQERTEKAIIAAGLAERWLAESKYDFDTMTHLLEEPDTPPEHRDRLRKKLRSFRIVVEHFHQALYQADAPAQAAPAPAPAAAEVKPPTGLPTPSPGGPTT